MAKRQSDNKDGICTRETDYSQWYLDIVKRAELAEHSNVRGCMVIRPNGSARCSLPWGRCC